MHSFVYLKENTTQYELIFGMVIFVSKSFFHKNLQQSISWQNVPIPARSWAGWQAVSHAGFLLWELFKGLLLFTILYNHAFLLSQIFFRHYIFREKNGFDACATALHVELGNQKRKQKKSVEAARKRKQASSALPSSSLTLSLKSRKNLSDRISLKSQKSRNYRASRRKSGESHTTLVSPSKDAESQAKPVHLKTASFLRLFCP